MVILIAIEGASGNALIDPAWSGSFMHELSRSWPDPSLARYLPGPDLSMASVEATAQAAATHAVTLHGVAQPKGIIVAGYSLGATAALLAARNLERSGLKVDFLALYDGVDPMNQASDVPANVADGMQVVRSWLSYSRPYWPKCANSGNLREDALMITHWGASGVLLTQGIPPGQPPQAYVQEQDPITNGVYNTALTWAGDQAAASVMHAKMQAGIQTAYSNCL